MRLTTHTNPDLDAICSLLFTKRSNISFVPANARGPFLGRPYDIAEGKGVFDGRQHSALASLAEELDLDVHPLLLKEVEEQETRGCIKDPRFSLADVLAAVKSFYRKQGLAGSKFDRKVLEWAEPLICGIQYQYEEGKKAQAVLRTCQVVRLADCEGIVYPVDPSPQLGILANAGGFHFAIFHDGMNLGVSRFPKRNKPDLLKLKGHLPQGWFIHPAGFLAAWGSRKAPATEPPPEGGPRGVEGLITTLHAIFGEGVV